MDDFKSELKALLEKYNATIEWDADGDLNGLSNERLYFYVGEGLAFNIEGCNALADDIK